MADKKNIGNDQRSGNSIQVLMEAAQTMTACRKNIQEAVETIVASCYTHGTRGETHKSLLLDKADGMRNLEELYGAVAKRFESAAMKLLSGIPEDKVWADVLAYSSFFADQLESEKIDCENILNIVRNDGATRNPD